MYRYVSLLIQTKIVICVSALKILTSSDVKTTLLGFKLTHSEIKRMG